MSRSLAVLILATAAHSAHEAAAQQPTFDWTKPTVKGDVLKAMASTIRKDVLDLGVGKITLTPDATLTEAVVHDKGLHLKIELRKPGQQIRFDNLEETTGKYKPFKWKARGVNLKKMPHTERFVRKGTLTLWVRKPSVKPPTPKREKLPTPGKEQLLKPEQEGPPTKNPGIYPIVVLERRQILPSKALQALGVKEQVRSLTFSGDGKYLLAGTAMTLVSWNWTTRKAVYESKISSGAYGLHVAPDVRLFAYGSANVGPKGIKFGPAVTATEKQVPTIPAFDMATGRKRSALRISAGVSQISIAPNGRWIAGIAFPVATGQRATTKYPKKQVVLIDAKTGSARRRLTPQISGVSRSNTSDEVFATAFSNDSLYLAAATTGGTLTVWDVARGLEVAVFRASNNPFDRRETLRWIGPHSSVVVPASRGFVRCDIKTKKLAPLSKHLSQTVSFVSKTNVRYALSPDGNRILFTEADRMSRVPEPKPLIVQDLAADRLIGRLPPMSGDSVSELAFSPDGKHLAIGTVRGRIMIYRIKDIESLAKQQAPLRFPGN